MGARRTPAIGEEELEAVLYFGTRPVARWRKVAAGASTLTYLTTDHLGTPILASSPAGTAVWSGGFEPYGRDYANAHAANIHLRLPGQLDDPLWHDSGFEAPLYYNVHRWYEYIRGSYLSVDPVAQVARGDYPTPYLYVSANPLSGVDPLGLFTVKGAAPACAVEYIENRLPELIDHPTIPGNLARVTGCPVSTVLEGLTWGSGPEIEFRDLPGGVAGRFRKDLPNEIRIDLPSTQQMCNSCCTDALLGFGGTILHEFAHQLHHRCRIGAPEPYGEVGYFFDVLTFGADAALRRFEAFLYGCK